MDPLDLPAWWSQVVLATVWESIANRLERNGIRPTGRLVVSGLDRSQRHALGDLLGRSVTSDRASIDLAVLDRRLSERAGVGLVEAVQQVRGRPLVDRPQRRAVQASRREEPFRAAERWLVKHPDAVWPWLASWLDGLRRDGSLMRRPNLVVTEVLTRAREARARMRYHGDFDWPGVAMANDALRRFGAVPWLMGVDDYLAAPGSLTLAGPTVEASWDSELGPAMRSRGLAVHEEAMMERLIDELSE